MHNMHKIAVDMKFAQMKSKKGIKSHGEQLVAAMYKYYIHIEDMKVMGTLDPESLTKSQKWGHYVQ